MAEAVTLEQVAKDRGLTFDAYKLGKTEGWPICDGCYWASMYCQDCERRGDDPRCHLSRECDHVVDLRDLQAWTDACRQWAEVLGGPGGD